MRRDNKVAPHCVYSIEYYCHRNAFMINPRTLNLSVTGTTHFTGILHATTGSMKPQTHNSDKSSIYVSTLGVIATVLPMSAYISQLALSTSVHPLKWERAASLSGVNVKRVLGVVG